MTHSVRQIDGKAVLFCGETAVSHSKQQDCNFWTDDCPKCGMVVRTFGHYPDNEIEEYHPKRSPR